jgi:radical SAM superfamily enzyme YgiQ (UPF0313 family)
MHFTGTTFRPPYEAASFILQVTVGCSHNACTFCSMYQDVPFSVSPLEEIEEDLEVVGRYPVPFDRVFLANGDAFCLSTERLVKIAELIHKYLPPVKSIGGYASVKNILAKSVDELRELAALGYANFNVGVESGLDDVLAYMNKGYTLQEAREAFARLNEAGMPFNLNIITAAAGPERCVEHARANAALVNEARPTLIFVSPLHVDPGSRLEGLVAEHDFVECTLRDYIEEEAEFLRNLELDDCVFFGTHVSNPVPVIGMLPHDKQRMLNELQVGMGRFSDWLLDSTPLKGLEGRML